MMQYQIENLSFSYLGNPHKVLDNVSLSIESGQYIVLCGRSGCGKTTLLRHLKSNLAPYGTLNGSVLFEGVPLDKICERRQASEIGFVMQNPDAQVVTDKVWHELAYGLESLGCDQSTMRMRVSEMASYFGIQSWFHRDVRELSGGQKQLLNLASIMAMQPSILILDEPTSQLDPIAASDFLNTIRKINLELGTTIILSEHRLEEVFPVADRVVVMENGRIKADADPRSIGNMLDSNDEAMFLSLPSPVRIYYGVARVDISSTIASGMADADADTSTAANATSTCPLTVREGRSWLSAYASQKNFAIDKNELELENPVNWDAFKSKDFALSMREVWFRYKKDGNDILRGVNLDIPRGCLYAIMGGNGTGKSTTLKAACGVVAPYRGAITVLGRKLKDWNDTELFRGGVALLPQDPQNLFVKKRVREDLLEMLSGSKLSKEERMAKVNDLVEFMGIEHLLESHPYDLSGGEQQRAALAKVLLTDPQILMLDEPTKGVDNAFKVVLAGLFRQLIDQGVTIIMSSHDVEFCAKYADMVSMFFDGSVASTNSPRRFFSQNSFYTTAANRMSRHICRNAILDEDVVELCAKMN